jgi:hypothetical protein
MSGTYIQENLSHPYYIIGVAVKIVYHLQNSAWCVDLSLTVLQKSVWGIIQGVSRH